MVTKSKKQTTVEKEQKRGRVKVGKLKLNKETVKDLNNAESKKVRGGQFDVWRTIECPTVGTRHKC